MTPIRSALASDLANLAQIGRLREVPNEDEDTLTGNHVDFCSNDYLGLARDHDFSAAASDASRELGAGAGASRLLGGGSAIHRRVERATATWLDDAIENTPEALKSDGLFFVSGYQANVGLLGALAMAGDTVFSDADNHASIIDGCRLARAEVEVFAHNDVEELSARLATKADRRRRIVVTEGVFSMGGDRAPIAELLRVCDRHDAWLVVDEAHAIGVLGPGGAGATADSLERDRSAPREPLLARVVTGGKALGVSGAIVVGPVGLREVLLNRARSQVFSTAASPATAGAFLTAVERVREASTLREDAQRNADRLASGLGLPTPDACIVPVVIGEDAAAMDIASKARRAGFDVRAVRPPTVPEGTARLRLVARATQTNAEIDALCSLLNELRSQAKQPRTTMRSQS